MLTAAIADELRLIVGDRTAVGDVLAELLFELLPLDLHIVDNRWIADRHDLAISGFAEKVPIAYITAR